MSYRKRLVFFSAARSCCIYPGRSTVHCVYSCNWSMCIDLLLTTQLLTKPTNILYQDGKDYKS